jgi:hypothetical protein
MNSSADETQPPPESGTARNRHAVRVMRKQEARGGQLQSFGSAMLNAALSNVTTVLTLESIAVHSNSNVSKRPNG